MAPRYEQHKSKAWDDIIFVKVEEIGEYDHKIKFISTNQLFQNVVIFENEENDEIFVWNSEKILDNAPILTKI